MTSTLRRSLTGSLISRARSPFSSRGSSNGSITSASRKDRKQWKRESDAIGRNLSRQGWQWCDEHDEQPVVQAEALPSSTGHESTLVDPSLVDFAIISPAPVPSADTAREDVVGGGAQSDNGESEDDGWRPPKPSKSLPQRIKPSFILSPRPFIPGLPTRQNSGGRYSYREPKLTPTASLSRKGSSRRRSGGGASSRLTARRVDSKRRNLSGTLRAGLSSLRRKRISSARGGAGYGDSTQSLMRLGFDSAILLTGMDFAEDDEEEGVDEFGKRKDGERKFVRLGAAPEDIPLPDSPTRSIEHLPGDEEEDDQPITHHRSTSLTNTSPSSSSLSTPPPTSKFPYLLPTHSPKSTVLKTGRKFRPYYTRAVSSGHAYHHLHARDDDDEGGCWDTKNASTYLFIQSIIVFAEPVLPDLNFLEGVSVPGVSEWKGRNVVPMGRAI